MAEVEKSPMRADQSVVDEKPNDLDPSSIQAARRNSSTWDKQSIAPTSSSASDYSKSLNYSESSMPAMNEPIRRTVPKSSSVAQIHPIQSDTKVYGLKRRYTTSGPDIQYRLGTENDIYGINRLLHRHVYSLLLPSVFYWLCINAKDYAAILSILIMILYNGNMYKILYIVVLFILYLFLRSFYEFMRYMNYECEDIYTLDTFKNMYISHAVNKLWVAEVLVEGKQQIIGCIGISMRPVNARSAQLVRLLVDKSYRGQGVGSSLFETALRYARIMNISDVYLSSNGLNTLSTKFLRNKKAQLFQILRRYCMRGDLLKWHINLSGNDIQAHIDAAMSIVND